MSILRNLPNLITIVRLVLAPVSVALIATRQWGPAFYVFVAAGLSDAFDGWLAKTFNLVSELGAHLDPLADKALLVSIYVSLAMFGEVPLALTALVVARDVMIVAAVLIAYGLRRPMAIRPLFISKLNTAAQIGLAGLLLGAKAFGFDLGAGLQIAIWSVAALTLASAMAYLGQWVRRMRDPKEA